MILRDLEPLIHTKFEVYYKGQYCGEFDFIEDDINNGSYEWILNSKITSIEVDTEDSLIGIYII